MCMTERLIDNSEAALFFINLTRANHLRPFLGQEVSLAEAAQSLELSTSHMSYWLKKIAGAKPH